jgi:small subunit ribosomal protein S6
MRQYEVTFIVDPVLSGDEIQKTASSYVDMLKDQKCNIVHIDETGLKQLAYPINRRNSGVYYTIEYASESGDIVPKVELALRRDERIMRFLTVKLDRYGIKYNDDKRNGLIGAQRKKQEKVSEEIAAEKAAAEKATAEKAAATEKATAEKAAAEKATAEKAAAAAVPSTPPAATPKNEEEE